MLSACDENSATSTQLAATVPVELVTVLPNMASIVPGGTVQLTARSMDAEGNTLANRSVTWSSRFETTATVDATGLVTGITAGSATITATAEGASGTAVITVLEPVASVTVTPLSYSMVPAEEVQLAATLHDALGNELTGRVITWSSARRPWPR